MVLDFRCGECPPPSTLSAQRTRQRRRDGPPTLELQQQESGSGADRQGWGLKAGPTVRKRGRESAVGTALGPPAWGRTRCLPYPEPSPGHALEAGWFLLRHTIRRGDPKLRAHVIDKFLLLPFRSGWDPDHGGLFYFQDADGLCPTQVGMYPGLHGTSLLKAFCPGRCVLSSPITERGTWGSEE